MTITRKFLGWDQPLLPLAVEHLMANYATAGRLALEEVLVVVPGARPGRQLLEQLARAANARNMRFLSPQMITIGQLPEYLYANEKPLASELLQKTAWVRALQNHPDTDSHLPRVPNPDDLVAWWEVASAIWQQHRELGAHGFLFDDVVRRSINVERFTDGPRWRYLNEVQKQMRTYLRDVGFVDPVAARCEAIDRQVCATSCDIVLVSTVDLGKGLRKMLRQVGPRVTSLIHAPEDQANLFDDCGCVDVDAWCDRKLPLQPEQLAVVGGTADQSQLVVRTLRSWSERYGVQEVTVAVPDEQVVPELQRQLLQVGVNARWLHQKTTDETGPYRLLELVVHYLKTSSFADFASLLRHPDIERWSGCRETPQARLERSDRYHQQHLPPHVGAWLGEPRGYHPLDAIHAAWEMALEPLRKPAASLHEWPDRIAEFLAAIYGDRSLQAHEEADQQLIETLSQINDALGSMRQIPVGAGLPVRAESALWLLLRQLEANSISAPLRDGSLELLGWLEVHLDLAPALIVTTFNEGCIPTSVSTDQFLPNSLREELGVDDNRKRFARDAYFVEALCRSRRDLRWIVVRRDTNENPMVPSRLAFTCRESELPDRCQQLFTSEGTSLREPSPWGCDPHSVSQLVVPVPKPLEEPLPSMSVTAFRDYLNCPYRFYLRHVLKLTAVDDEDEELSPRVFGNLIHDVLDKFGEDNIRESNKESEIREFLIAMLQQCAVRTLGSHPQRSPAVNVQLRGMQTRLERFAAWQAKRADDGWRIQYTEHAFREDDVTLEIGDVKPMQIVGRIDRIDFHPETDQWEILDYKTSDTAKDPMRAHHKKGAWIDLQLPLYRFMVQKLNIPLETMRLGYFQVPKDPSKIGPMYANWDDAMLEDALQTAQNVVRAVRAEKFWPPRDQPEMPVREFEGICGQVVVQKGA